TGEANCKLPVRRYGLGPAGVHLHPGSATRNGNPGDLAAGAPGDSRRPSHGATAELNDSTGFKNGLRPFEVTHVRAPVFVRAPGSCKAGIEDRLVRCASADTVHNASRNHAHIAGMW